MLRWIYLRLLRAHPAQFRNRFGDEMLDAFDRYAKTSHQLRLLGDAAASVLRQWVLRPEFRQPWQAAVSTGRPGSGTPYHLITFQQIEEYKPSRAALAQGGLMAILLLMGIVYAINHGGNKLRHLLIGMHRPGGGLIQVSRESMEAEAPTTTVDTGRLADDPWRPFARSYFANLRLAGALDADHNLTITAAEILAAPQVLRGLDRDGDGNLSPEECGFAPPGDFTGDAKLLARDRREFMLVHPLLAALDSDHDGRISASEIANAPSAVRSLDAIHDDQLTPYEVLPARALAAAAAMITRYDTNDDAALSVSELPKDAPESARAILLAADRNHDGVVTRGELVIEIALRPVQ